VDSYSVQAVLSVVDKNFSSTMKAAGGAMDDLEGSSKKTKTSILDIAKGVGVFKLVEKATGALVGSLDGAIKRYDTMNQFPKVMEAIGFSTIQSERSVKKLADGIDGLPTSLDAIVGSTQKIALLTGDLDKATETSIALNNAFLASGSATADAERGLVQYTQMLSKGMVDGQSWKTLQETMGVALNELAAAFGFAGESAQNDLYAALQNGQVTFDQLNDKVIELDGGLNGFASRAAEASAGIGTSMQNLRTAMVKGVTTIIEATDQMLADNGFPKIAKIIDNAKVGINKSTKAIASSIGVAGKAVMGLSPYLKIGATAWVAYRAAMSIDSVVKKVTSTIKSAQQMVKIATTTNKAYTVVLGANAKAKALQAVAEAKGYTVSAAGQLVTKAGNVLTAKSTELLLAQSGVITGKSLIVGVLTGKIGIVTAAQMAWNAAMAANPIGAIIAVVAALGAGIYALSRAFADNSTEAKKLKREHNELISSSKELVSASKDASKSRKDNASDMEIEAQAARGLASDVVELSKKQNKSAADHKELQSYVTMLNNSVEGLNLSYDEQSGALSMTSKEIDKMIDSYASLAKTQAAQEALVEVEKERLSVNSKMAEVEEKLNDARADNFTTMVKGIETTHNVTKAERELAIQLAELEEEYKSLGIEVGVYSDTLKTSAQEQADAVINGVGQQISSLNDLSESQRGTIDSMNAAWQSYLGHTTNMFDTLSDKQEMSGEQMKANLLENQRVVGEWADNLASLAERGVDKGMLEELKRLGPEGAGHVAALNEMTQDELMELSSIYADGASAAVDAYETTWDTSNIPEVGREAIFKQAEGMQAEIDAQFPQLANNAVATFGDTLADAVGVTNASIQMVDKAVDAAAKAGIKFEDVGRDGMDGLHIGMLARANGISDAAAEIILDGIKAAKEAQDSHSPSVVYEGLGNDAIDGYVQGVEGQQGVLDSAVTGAIKKAMEAATKATQSGIKAMSNISTSSFMQIATKAKMGMSAMSQAITGGMKTSRNAMQSGMNVNVQVTTVSMQRMRSVTQAGMSANTQVVTSGMRTMQSATTSGMSALARAVQVGMNSSQNAVRSGISTMNAIVSNLQSGFYSSGVYASQGLARGIDAGANSAMAAARRVASSVATTMRNSLKIHSPSRVTEEIGEFTAEGVEVGMLNRLQKVKTVANRIADAMLPQESISSRMAYAGYTPSSVSMENTFSSSATYTIVVPVEMDGREIARATATYTKEEIEKQERRNNRMHGRR